MGGVTEKWSCVAAALVVLIVCTHVEAKDCFSVVETPIRELQAALANETITCVELVQSYLDRIEAYDQAGPKLNSFITLNAQALAEAAEMDTIPLDDRKPLHCIPFVAKDLFNAVGMPTTAGSVVLAESYGSDDAFIVRLLKEEGALLMGKVNLAELALGLAGGTNSSLGGQTLNSYALDRSPQGSSGGTATAVAASFAAFGLGTDTNASILSPSNVQSLFGLRSTQGLISGEGVFPLFPLQDTPGPMCRTAEDLAIVMDVIDAGHAALRPDFNYTSAEVLDVDALKKIRVGFLNQTIAYNPPFIFSDSNVIDNSQQVIASLRALNVSVTIIPDVIKWEFWFDILNAIQVGPCTDSIEYNSYNLYLGNYTSPTSPVKTVEELLAAMESDPDEYENVTDFVESIVDGATISCPTKLDYTCTIYQEIRTELARFNEFALARYNVDVLMFPPMNRESQLLYSDETQLYPLSWAFLSASSGMPTIVVPAGYSPDGTPLGMAFMARNYQEPMLISLAYSFDNLIHARVPPASTPDLC